MKKMKKLLALLLAVVMVVGFAACSSNKEGDDKKASTKGEISVFYYTFSDAYISSVRSAMDKILKHYKPYIVKLSIRTDGDKSYIDEDLRERLEAKLIAKTLEFETA